MNTEIDKEPHLQTSSGDELTDNNHYSSTENSVSMTNKIIRATFGIFMVIVYMGMGVLLLINYFNWVDNEWSWTRYLVGIVLIIYGIWRGWRQYKGVDYYVR